MSLETYLDKFTRLRVNVVGGRASPHKICMLLAALDLARSGGITENKLFFAPPLLERYARLFNAVRTEGDHPNPYLPFFHLKGNLTDQSSSFWHLQPIPGREAQLHAIKTARNVRDIVENILCVTLDPELFELIQSPAAIERLGEAISKTWFDRGLAELSAVVVSGSEISNYERQLRSLPVIVASESAPPAYIRNPAFRRIVTEIYDYRCAATGVRLILPSGQAMVEAAHIHPFNVAGDDDPRNGLALTPNMHWAMDKNLIAPGPDFKWHVSALIDDRIPDNAMLTELDGRRIFLPSEARMYPKQDALEWRMEKLRVPGWLGDGLFS